MNHPDQSEWEAEVAEQERLADQLRSIGEEPVFAYLARHGDAIQQRVDLCRSQAAALLSAGFPGAALVRATAGMELTVRFLLVRPMLQGAFLSDTWSELRTARITGSRTSDDRALIPAVLRNWDIEITEIRLDSGTPRWQAVQSHVWDRRNDYVHQRADAQVDEAQLALDCLDVLRRKVVDPFAVRLGFSRKETARWSVVLSPGDRTLNSHQTYEVSTPFEPHNGKRASEKRVPKRGD